MIPLDSAFIITDIILQSLIGDYHCSEADLKQIRMPSRKSSAII